MKGEGKGEGEARGGGAAYVRTGMHNVSAAEEDLP